MLARPQMRAVENRKLFHRASVLAAHARHKRPGHEFACQRCRAGHRTSQGATVLLRAPRYFSGCLPMFLATIPSIIPFYPTSTLAVTHPGRSWSGRIPFQNVWKDVSDMHHTVAATPFGSGTVNTGLLVWNHVSTLALTTLGRRSQSCSRLVSSRPCELQENTVHASTAAFVG